MAMFVHLTLESGVARIQRNGISRSRRTRGEIPRGVFAVPVTHEFYISHQRLRELKRFSDGALAGVYFRVPDDELIWVGHYNQSHRRLRAAEAVAEFTAAEKREGWEVVIPRRIEVKEIHRTKSLPQVLGWRYFPGSERQTPFLPM
jgi:hypothetical protein